MQNYYELRKKEKEKDTYYTKEEKVDVSNLKNQLLASGINIKRFSPHELDAGVLGFTDTKSIVGLLASDYTQEDINTFVHEAVHVFSWYAHNWSQPAAAEAEARKRTKELLYD